MRRREVEDLLIRVAEAGHRLKAIADDSLSAAKGREIEPAVQRHVKASAAFDSFTDDMRALIALLGLTGAQP